MSEENVSPDLIISIFHFFSAVNTTKIIVKVILENWEHSNQIWLLHLFSFSRRRRNWKANVATWRQTPVALNALRKEQSRWLDGTLTSTLLNSKLWKLIGMVGLVSRVQRSEMMIVVVSLFKFRATLLSVFTYILSFHFLEFELIKI